MLLCLSMAPSALAAERVSDDEGAASEIQDEISEQATGELSSEQSSEDEQDTGIAALSDMSGASYVPGQWIYDPPGILDVVDSLVAVSPFKNTGFIFVQPVTPRSGLGTPLGYLAILDLDAYTVTTPDAFTLRFRFPSGSFIVYEFPWYSGWDSDDYTKSPLYVIPGDIGSSFILRYEFTLPTGNSPPSAGYAFSPSMFRMNWSPDGSSIFYRYGNFIVDKTDGKLLPISSWTSYPNHQYYVPWQLAGTSSGSDGGGTTIIGGGGTDDTHLIAFTLSVACIFALLCRMRRALYSFRAC